MAQAPVTFSRLARSWPAIFSAKDIWRGSAWRSERFSGESQVARQPVPPTELTNDAERIMRICNSCRYCEGYCAVFPAIERRQSFAQGDLNYLANLCHNCIECYYACQ